MRAADTLALLATLADSCESPVGLRYFEGFVQSARPGIFGAATTGRDLAQQERARLRMAEAYWVSGDMLAVADQAQRGMTDTALVAEELPSEYGFLVFERPMLSTDVNGEQVSTKALLWSTANHRLDTGERVRGIVLTAYSDREDALAEESVFGTYLVGLTERERALLPRLSMLHATFWPFDKQTYVSDARDRTFHTMLAVWSLMGQTLAERHEEEPDRRTRKRMLRLDLPSGPVTVVSLRRRAPSGDPTGATLGYRQLVRGHYRTTHYRDAETGEMREHRVYIKPYVRGPEDAPFSTREQVYALRR